MTILKVYDMQGREVNILANEMKLPGKYSVTIDTQNLLNGVYFYQWIAGSSVQTRKCMIVKKGASNN